MNIFYLSADPKLCAQAHCDRHVVKMILESHQLLSAAWYLNPDLIGAIEIYGKVLPSEVLTRPAFLSHPCSKWAAASSGNYYWLHSLAVALLEEYAYRFDRSHASSKKIHLLEDIPFAVFEKEFSPPPRCMPAYIRDAVSDPVTAYRMYYLLEKRHLAEWTRRPEPQWWLEALEKGTV